jgi:hypothetical protein
MAKPKATKKGHDHNHHNHHQNMTTTTTTIAQLQRHARTLAAAGLFQENAPLHLSYQTLITTAKRPPLMAAAGHLMVGLVASASSANDYAYYDNNHHNKAAVAAGAQKLFAMYLMVHHAPSVFFETLEGAEEQALLKAAAAFHETFHALIAQLLLLQPTTAVEELLPPELTARLLSELHAYEGAFAAWKAVDDPRLEHRLRVAIDQLLLTRALVLTASPHHPERLQQIDTQLAHTRGLLARLLPSSDASAAAPAAALGGDAAPVAADMMTDA